jgi:hypothetical protein
VVTIAAPSDPSHVKGLFGASTLAAIEAEGEAQVQLTGRPFRIKSQFLADASAQNLSAKTAAMQRAPADDAFADRHNGRYQQCLRDFYDG